MKNFIQTTLLLLFTVSFSWGQNQTYTAGTTTYTFNNTGNFQLTGIPDGTVVQVECYGAGGGGGGIWTAHFASTSSGGGGGGGYAKLNSYTVNGGVLEVIVGKGGLKGTGSSSLEEAYDGQDGSYSAVYSLTNNDTLCKATGGEGSPHQSASNGGVFSPAKALGPAGNSGQGTIGDILMNGEDGTTGTTPSFSSGKGGNGGDGAGTLGGAGGVYNANIPGANYGAFGTPYGGGGSGCADYEGGGGATYKIGGNGADGGVIITISDLSITTQPLSTTSFCTGDEFTVDYIVTGTFITGNTFNLELSNATGDFSSPTVIGSINSTTSGSINGTLPALATTGTGYQIRVTASQPALIGTENSAALAIQETPASPTASPQDFCGTTPVSALSPNGADFSWYASSSSSTPLLDTETLSTQEYFVSKTVNGCESEKTSVQINAYPLPLIDAGTNQTICEGTAVTLTASNPDGATITWDNGVIDGNSFTPPVGINNYTVTATKNGCFASSQVEITVNESPNFTVLGTNPTNCSVPDGEIVITGLIASSDYSITYNGNSPVSITSNSTGTILISGLYPGSYSPFTVENSSNCTTTDNSTIVLIAPTTPKVSVNNAAFCSGEDSTLIAVGIPSGGTYNWTPAPDITSISDSSVVASPISDQSYTVTYTLNGCSSSAIAQVIVRVLPIAIAGDTLPSICINETSVVMNGSIGGGATNGYWIGGSGTWTDVTDPSQATYTAGANDLGWIHLGLVASGSNCPNDTVFNMIKVNDCTLELQTENQNKLKLYPNPVHNFITIEGERLATDYNSYVLTSMTGQIVKSGRIRSNHQTINVLDLNKGMYVLQMTGKRQIIRKVEIQ